MIGLGFKCDLSEDILDLRGFVRISKVGVQFQQGRLSQFTVLGFLQVIGTYALFQYSRNAEINRRKTEVELRLGKVHHAALNFIAYTLHQIFEEPLVPKASLSLPG